MKATKFLILAAGVLGLLAFFLPYAKVDLGSGKAISFSAMDVMKGVELAQQGVSDAKRALEDHAAELGATRAEVRGNMKEIEDVLNMVKVVILLCFAPALVLAAIGGFGMARRRLGRAGGAGAVVLGVIGLAINGLFLAAWNTTEVKSAGGGAAIGQHLLVAACAIGFIAGVLTLIKPDTGRAS